jgi:hypothetical protein
MPKNETAIIADEMLEELLSTADKLGEAAGHLSHAIDEHLKSNMRVHHGDAHTRQGADINIMNAAEHARLVGLMHRCADFQRGVRVTAGRPMPEHEKK